MTCSFKDRPELAAAAGMIAPVLADVAVTSTRRLLQRRNRVFPVASLLRRQLAEVIAIASERKDIAAGFGPCCHPVRQ